jgi:hypothetical protein
MFASRFVMRDARPVTFSSRRVPFLAAEKNGEARRFGTPFFHNALRDGKLIPNARYTITNHAVAAGLK